MVLGIVIGAAAVFFLNKSAGGLQSTEVHATESADWNWPDSLDAMVAAADNHALVFENDELRILSVTVVPGILDPIHTHKGRSIVWVTKTSPILYNVYDRDNNGKLKLIRTDTINVKPSELNQAAWEKPEGPHSVENIGKDTFHLYRIEYKKNRTLNE